MAMGEVKCEDLHVILKLLESDYFKEELQLELGEIAEKTRVLSSKLLGQLPLFALVKCAVRIMSGNYEDCRIS